MATMEKAPVSPDCAMCGEGVPVAVMGELAVCEACLPALVEPVTEVTLSMPDPRPARAS